MTTDIDLSASALSVERTNNLPIIREDRQIDCSLIRGVLLFF